MTCECKRAKTEMSPPAILHDPPRPLLTFAVITIIINSAELLVSASRISIAKQFEELKRSLCGFL